MKQRNKARERIQRKKKNLNADPKFLSLKRWILLPLLQLKILLKPRESCHYTVETFRHHIFISFLLSVIALPEFMPSIFSVVQSNALLELNRRSHLKVLSSQKPCSFERFKASSVIFSSTHPFPPVPFHRNCCGSMQQSPPCRFYS